MNYIETFIEELHKNLKNNFNDNWDEVRYGVYKPKHNSIKNKFIKFFQKYLYSKNYINFNILLKNRNIISNFEYLFNLLNNIESKKLLINILLYRILGHNKVKLPLNNTNYFKTIKNISSLKDENNFLILKYNNQKLYYFDLNNLNFPIKLYFSEIGINIDFILKQYEYESKEVLIKAENSDIVIDGGGLWGDTSLFFASSINDYGKVYCFEFIPDNIQILNKNFNLNPKFKNKIELIEHPIWENSDLDMYYKDDGPGSIVTFDKFENFDGKVSSLSIDDLVIRNNIEKIDFIKLDIEGAELQALKGAKESIKKFRPKLAVAIYHHPDDFYSIPKFLNELNLGYKFYLKHLTIHNEETILFAKV